MKNKITKIIVDADSFKDGESLVTIDSNGKIIDWHYGVGKHPIF